MRKGKGVFKLKRNLKAPLSFFVAKHMAQKGKEISVERRNMKVTIGHLYPDLLNLYGDTGNVRCLIKRCEWRGIEVELKNFERDDVIDFSNLDIVLLGGGSDHSQQLVCRQLQRIRDSFQKYVDDISFS